MHDFVALHCFSHFCKSLWRSGNGDIQRYSSAVVKPERSSELLH